MKRLSLAKEYVRKSKKARRRSCCVEVVTRRWWWSFRHMANAVHYFVFVLPNLLEGDRSIFQSRHGYVIRCARAQVCYSTPFAFVTSPGSIVFPREGAKTKAFITPFQPRGDPRLLVFSVLEFPGAADGPVPSLDDPETLRNPSGFTVMGEVSIDLARIGCNVFEGESRYNESRRVDLTLKASGRRATVQFTFSMEPVSADGTNVPSPRFLAACRPPSAAGAAPRTNTSAGGGSQLGATGAPPGESSGSTGWTAAPVGGPMVTSVRDLNVLRDQIVARRAQRDQLKLQLATVTRECDELQRGNIATKSLNDLARLNANARAALFARCSDQLAHGMDVGVVQRHLNDFMHGLVSTNAIPKLESPHLLNIPSRAAIASVPSRKVQVLPPPTATAPKASLPISPAITEAKAYVEDLTAQLLAARSHLQLLNKKQEQSRQDMTNEIISQIDIVSATEAMLEEAKTALATLRQQASTPLPPPSKATSVAKPTGTVAAVGPAVLSPAAAVLTLTVEEDILRHVCFHRAALAGHATLQRIVAGERPVEDDGERDGASSSSAGGQEGPSSSEQQLLHSIMLEFLSLVDGAAATSTGGSGVATVAGQQRPKKQLDFFEDIVMTSGQVNQPSGQPVPSPGPTEQAARDGSVPAPSLEPVAFRPTGLAPPPPAAKAFTVDDLFA